MSSRLLALTLATMAVSATQVYAQHRGTVELGGFARYGKYDTDLGLENAAGWGGRLGFFLSPDRHAIQQRACAPDGQSPHGEADGLSDWWRVGIQQIQ